MNRTAFALLMLAAPLLSAQQTGVVVGVIADSATTRALGGAIVTLTSLGYEDQQKSEEDGVFRFTRVKPGRYTVAARRLGYTPFTMTVDVGEQPDTIRVALVRIATLDTVRVGSGTGIYGVIGTGRDMRPLRGVEVQIIGSGGRAITDSSGRFFVPLSKAGAYVVRTRINGFGSQTASVTVVKGTASEVTLLLNATSVATSNKTETAWKEFADRVRRRGAASALVSRGELLANRHLSLIEAIQQASSVTGKNLRFTSTVCVFVDGYPSATTPVNHFLLETIEAVEVYTADPRSDETNSIRRQSRGYECHPTGFAPTAGTQRDLIKWVVIWVKP